MRVYLASVVSAIFVLALTASDLHADTVMLVNDDKISGRLVTMEQGKLTIATSYAGEIIIDWEEVVEIITAESVEVVLSDQTSLRGRLQETEQGKVKLTMGSVVETVSFDLAAVEAINPQSAAEPAVSFSGRINVGLSKSSGNTDSESHHIDGEIIARTETNRYTAGIEYNREESDDEVTDEQYLGYVQYDHFLTEKWYTYVNTLFEKNEFKDLNLRSTIGVGMGYQFYESELTQPSRQLPAES